METDTPMTLADIYYSDIDQPINNIKNKKLGF
jgi:hypothetical protein